MKLEELEQLAAMENAELPEGLELPEELLFLTLRQLYGNFRSGLVPRDIAKKEKARILTGYDKLSTIHTLAKKHSDIQRQVQNYIGSYYLHGCEQCRKLINIFTGVDYEME